MRTCTIAAIMLAYTGLAETPSGYLAKQEKPSFRQGHTLVPLTRYGWTLPMAARIELARNWGYCLEFGGYVTAKSAAKLDDPDSTESKLAALAAANPETYPLSVICCRNLPTSEFAGLWTRDADGNLINGKAQSLDGNEWHKGMKTVYSPEAPDAAWKEAGRLRAEPIKRVRDACPIAVVLNGGEYGINVLGFGQKGWEEDPAVTAARGDRDWFDYLSERKANAETLIAKAVRAVVPDSRLYIYYPTTGGTHRRRYGGWNRWGYAYRWMKSVSTLASSEHYWQHFNTGWTGKQDMLTMGLNARGEEIAQGQPFCYDWFCAGWPRGKRPNGGLGELDRYTGFLKCMYVSGMLGGNAGYYAYPKGGFGVEFPEDEPPHWLRQMTTFARVHALFSHLESDIREGDLLPGPNRHVWSKDHPAYEFPTGDPEARVVARRRKDTTRWLVAAWAAGGEEREVKVTIPDAGTVAMLARPAGSVYLVQMDNGQAVPLLADPEPERPSRHAATLLK
ncbi:MAG: hypothetical protein HN742_42460 [Lentisphaerae bacterium]|jgi:hypothetical protein|nr:hypothetical protein [Lentisphaerota bacterium]MBT4821502.1 hypothetical protein [Lentisphaerota bacterium]MBT5605404.1 hypothetical protein [Lentisphaerota bacterium]MBT7062028.1 hypothetical protein [Lentisphaerota bacterium]MBT7848602.1 hypothetical protein [Lentisphaerota bacterium]